MKVAHFPTWIPCITRKVAPHCIFIRGLHSLTLVQQNLRKVLHIIPQRISLWTQNLSRVQYRVVPWPAHLHILHTALHLLVLPSQGLILPGWSWGQRSLSTAFHHTVLNRTMLCSSACHVVRRTSSFHSLSTVLHKETIVLCHIVLYRLAHYALGVPHRILNLHWTRRALDRTALLICSMGKHRTRLHWTRTSHQQEDMPQLHVAHHHHQSDPDSIVCPSLLAQYRPALLRLLDLHSLVCIL